MLLRLQYSWFWGKSSESWAPKLLAKEEDNSRGNSKDDRNQEVVVLRSMLAAAAADTCGDLGDI